MDRIALIRDLVNRFREYTYNSVMFSWPERQKLNAAYLALDSLLWDLVLHSDDSDVDESEGVRDTLYCMMPMAPTA